MNQKKQKTILIVEDEEPLRKILRDVLPKNGFSILEAKNGREAITQALHNHPDLILLDLLLPEMSGLTALEKIRTDSWGTKVPVIILTNLSADKEELVQSMVKQRPISYLIKSDWKIEEVISRIKEALHE